jgi:flagellar hook-associated protein 2
MTSIYGSSGKSSANLLRISGMASGIDTDSVVKSMVSSYQTKIDKANQAKQTLQWKQEAYRDIIKGVKGLQEYFDPLSDKYLLSGKSLNTNSTSSADDTIVSATAGAGAKAGTYKVNVSQLATQANIAGSGLNSMVEATDGSKWNNATLQFNTISVSLGSITDTNSDGKTTLDEVAKHINDKISVDSRLNGKISVSADANGNLLFKNQKAAGTGAIAITATTSGGTNGNIFSTTISEQSSYNYNEYIPKWNNATLTLDTNLKLDDITDVNKLVENINSKISANSSLNGKISAKVDATDSSKIVFENTSNTKISLGVDSSPAIEINAQSEGTTSFSISDLSGKDLNLSTSITLGNITDVNNSGSVGLDDVVASINSKISSNSAISGKISASYVNDGSSSYIKFTGSSSMNLTVTSSGGTSGDLFERSINNGISSASKLMSDLNFSSNTTKTGDIKFTLNGSTVSLEVDDSTTVQDLMDAVNSATSGAVTMNIDDSTGKISFQSKSYGSASNVVIANDSSATNDILAKLGISTTTATGTDAIVSITAPGQSAVTTTQSSNNFTINGITYNLVSKGETTTTVTANSDTVVSNMKKFIEDYNTIISSINTKLTEKKNSDYPPLTDAQKEDMSEDQIKTWEAKAKVGILKNDDYLNTLMSQLRGIFSSPVYSSYDTDSSKAAKVSLSFGSYGTNAIGIDTSNDYTDGGKLVLKDEAKLKSAIENNLEDFKKLFIGASSASLDSDDSKKYIGSKKYMEDGLFKRIDTILRDYVATPGLGKDGTYTLSGSMNIFVNKQYDYSSMGYSSKNTLPDQVYKQTLSISKLKTQMSDAENRYYAKFTALETAMNALNSQQSTLSSMLGISQ